MSLEKIRSNGYVFQVEMIYVACKVGCNFKEVPFYFADRKIGKSKMSFKIQAEAAINVWRLPGYHKRYLIILLEEKMGKTQKDLEDAFAGESQASRKYFHFAKKAEQEGYTQVAKLFRAAAVAETVHAGNHLRVLNGIKDTRSNLQEAINGENYEVTTMYPEFIADAQAEGDCKSREVFLFG